MKKILTVLLFFTAISIAGAQNNTFYVLAKSGLLLRANADIKSKKLDIKT